MRHMNLQPEIDHIVQKVNNQIDVMRGDDITEEYTVLLINSINIDIIEKYRLNRHDIELIENYLKEQKPDYFLIGLTGKDIRNDSYSKNLEFLLVRLNNTYVSNRREHRTSFWYLVAAGISTIVAIAALIVSILKE